MYVKVKELPPCVHLALIDNGYNRPDVEVKASETFSLSPGTAFEGNRGFVCAVNLQTYEQKSLTGSWGGANPFEHSIDHDDTSRALPPGMAIIKGESGGRGSFARVYVHPETLAKMLPAPQVELNEAQGVVLYCLKSLKSSYRRDEASRYGVDSHTYDITVAELAVKGFAKVSSNGATQITTEGKNALAGFKLPKERYY